MKKASIISIGNELLGGQTVDSNAAYLGENLYSIGLPVVSGYTVGDEADRIVRAIELASEDSDVVLITGGLGPTDDDITRQCLAEFLGVELVLNEGLLLKIEQYFASRGLKMASVNKVQAYLPAGSEAIGNELGTAPGIMSERDGKIYFVMPGVPSEMKRMFSDSVEPVLKRLCSGQAVVISRLKCFGTGESNIAEKLGDLMERGRNPLINCTVSYGVITLHIIATAEAEIDAERMASKDEARLRGLLGDVVYGSGDESLSEVVGRRLAEQGKTISVAESCTGGLIGEMLTDNAGASEYFRYGWTTYSNEAKISELGVERELIEEFGAVSGEVAEAMAKGARERSGSDISIGITGIAGPGGGSEQKPVGLVYICVDSEAKRRTGRYVFSHDRAFVRLRGAQTALNMVRQLLGV